MISGSQVRMSALMRSIMFFVRDGPGHLTGVWRPFLPVGGLEDLGTRVMMKYAGPCDDAQKSEYERTIGFRQ